MNERIEQLALECYQAPEFDYKKFAELIVRECVEIVDARWDPVLVEKIKEHFGVEE
jgi:hypothetical protein